MADLLAKKLTGLHLIDASAGTGKTYTITALVVRLLLERRLIIQEILVVTYTEAAVADLRLRIRERLLAARNFFSGHKTADDFLAELGTTIHDHEQARRDLTCALNDFDEAAIYTIHAFCQRMLTENGLESGTLFDVELAADLADIHWQVVCDYWRREVADKGALFLGYSQNRLSPDRLLGLLGRQRPGLKIYPKPVEGATDVKAAESQYLKLAHQARDQWPQAAAQMAAVLEHPSLKKNLYRAQSLAGWLAAVSAFFNQAQALPPDCLVKFGQQSLDAAAKKNCQPPVHPFASLVDELWQAWQQLRDLFDAKVLAIKTGLFAYADGQISTLKEQQRLLGFDDLLSRLHTGLVSDNGPALARRIRNKYPAALIDEFQDTDPLQFAIFSRIHGQEAAHLLYLIGDPKQAIYNFRGADIFAYLAAARQVKNRHTLEYNYRSEPALVAAVNQIFQEKQGVASFIFDDIVFSPARWPEKDRARLTVEEGEQAALQIMLAEQEEDGKQLSAPQSKVFAIHSVCAEICRLLDLAGQNRARLGERPLAPRDIAVLVRTNDEARQVHQALLEVGVASVVKSSDDLFASHEAGELVAVLRAVSEPRDEGKLAAALATDLLGWSARQLYNRFTDEDQWDGVLERFASYHDLWQRQGFMAMFQALAKGEDVRCRLLRLQDGERRLTNFLHLGEVLQAKRGLAMHHLVDYLVEGVAGRHGGEHEQRLESDAQRLQIVTVHKSKGLQYGVVFCPFLWGGSQVGRQGEVFFHDDSGKLALDLGSAEFDRHRQAAEREELAENLRLAYVALTRARNRCYVLWGPFYNSQYSGLAHLFHARADEGRAEFLARLAGLTGNELAQDLQGLVAAGEGAISLVEPSGEVKWFAEQGQEGDEPVFTAFAGHINRSWQVSSFSRLTAGLHQEAYIPDYDRQAEVLVGLDGNEAEPGQTIFDFPKGAGPGTFLHHLLENLDFTGLQGKKAEVESWLTVKLQQFGFGQEWQPAIYKMLSQLVAGRLPENSFCLAEVSPDQRLNELEFYLPLAASHASELYRLFARHGGRGGQSFLAQLQRLDYRLMQGFLKGFIDLVFCHAGRYFIIDWKSNYLGHGLEAYGASQLEAAMVEHNYILQYHLYTVALDRYLANRLPDYSYEEHFGGVFYHFLRGLQAGSDSGIYYDRPQVDLINDLGALLALPGRAQQGRGEHV